MKKIFALAIALVSMAVSMTSCGNDNDMVKELDPANNPAADQQKQEDIKKETESVVEFYLPVTNVQLEMMDMAITYTIDGQSTTIKPEDMTEVAFPEYFVVVKEGVGEPKLLKYIVAGKFTDAQLKNATYERSVNWKEEGLAKYQNEKVNIFINYFCQVVSDDTDTVNQKLGFAYIQSYNMSHKSAADDLFNNMVSFSEKTNMLR